MLSHYLPKVVLDLRSPAEYEEGHPVGAFSFPWPELEQRCAALPPRHVDLHLLTSVSDAQEGEIRRYFTQSGYKQLTFCRPTEVDCTSRSLPAGFCWRPNPFLVQHLPSLSPGIALDVGSGAGRDLVFLASRGWATVGFDNRTHLAARCRDFAELHKHSQHVGVTVADARRNLPFRREAFDMVHVCRFIHRPLIPVLIALLRPGGSLLYSHFLQGCEVTARGYPRNESGFFHHGELESLLTSEGLTILVKETDTLDDGRPMIHVLARKL